MEAVYGGALGRSELLGLEGGETGSHGSGARS